jgi:hypothetical protein
VHAEDAHLRRVDDRGREQRAIDTAIGDGKGAARHLCHGQRAVACFDVRLRDIALDLR